MNTAAGWRSGVATDLGLRRTVNEDRVLADDARGIFLVVDGLGGHAAGEIAAETALRTIEARMRSLDLHSDAEALIRQAITEANNQISDLAENHHEWQGMACVLTLAIVQEDRVTIGHVGDSRLYLLWNGQLKKVTSDHSPVGEQEDQGALTEEQAMKHPRRNEVFRDVGTCRRSADDPQFIETKSFVFRPDAALLLSSDGLSDVLTSAEITAVLETYDGAPEKTAQQLIDAANEAGGNDNISVIFVPGPEFVGSHSQRLLEARPRHAITRSRDDSSRWRTLLLSLLWLLAGVVLGFGLSKAIEQRKPPAPAPQPASVSRAHTAILVDSADAHGIQKALETAVAGDTIEIPAGDYLGPLELKDQVNVVGKAPKEVSLRSDPSAVKDGGIGIVARGIRYARVEGLRVIADETHPLAAGVWIQSSSLELANLDVSGAIEAGIRIDGASNPVLLANFIHSNSGAGITIKKQSAPRLVGNWIEDNGKLPHALRQGIEIDADARPQLERNVVLHNGLTGSLPGDPFKGMSK